MGSRKSLHESINLTEVIDIKSLNVRNDVTETIVALCKSAISLVDEISLSGLGADHRSLAGKNTDGDNQKKLDVIADDLFRNMLKEAGIGFYASEELEHIETLNEDGKIGVAIDPLDGSSNIDCNVSIGTIFSVKDINEKDSPEKDFFNLGNYLAAGYFIYGPQTLFVFSCGQGVLKYILNPKNRRFEIIPGKIEIPRSTNEYAINGSNYRHWPMPVRNYIDECLDGASGPKNKNFNTRWVASLVAETHRILERGGVFLYPGDDREGYSEGRLRMVYECGPIAFLIEQAKGGATNGTQGILELNSKHLHQRTPFVFGSMEEVESIKKAFDDPKAASSPLFKTRGLFNR